MEKWTRRGSAHRGSVKGSPKKLCIQTDSEGVLFMVPRKSSIYDAWQSAQSLDIDNRT